MAKQICINPVFMALRGNFIGQDQHGHKETLRFRETAWGTKSFGLGKNVARNYTTNPLTPDEQAARAAFTAATALRKLICDNAALRATWLKRLNDAKKAGTTKCNTLNGFLMNQAINGHISESGQYQE